MLETVIVIVVVLLVVGLILWAVDRVAFPTPTGPLIKMVIIVATIAIACVYLVNRFL
jgi:hypothetical protein